MRLFWTLNNLIHMLVCISTVKICEMSAGKWSKADDSKPAAVKNSSRSSRDTPDSQPTVQINYGISADRRAQLSCEVRINADSQRQLKETPKLSLSIVYLICPQITTSICYYDCIPSCLFNENECKVPQSLSRVIERCQYLVIANTKLVVRYTVNMEALDKTGNWSCEYQGVRATSLKLQAAEPRSTNKTTTTTTAIPALASKGHKTTLQTEPPPVFSDTQAELSKRQRTMENTWPESTRESLRSFSKDVWQDGPLSLIEPSAPHQEEVGTDDSTLMKIIAMTRPEIIFALMIILMFTIIVNIALFIRCCLTSSYIESLKRGNPNRSLEKLLCHQSSENEKSRAKNYLTEMPTPDSYHYLSGPFPPFVGHVNQQTSDCSTYDGKLQRGSSQSSDTQRYKYLPRHTIFTKKRDEVLVMPSSSSENCIKNPFPPTSSSGFSAASLSRCRKEQCQDTGSTISGFSLPDGHPGYAENRQASRQPPPLYCVKVHGDYRTPKINPESRMRQLSAADVAVINCEIPMYTTQQTAFHGYANQVSGTVSTAIYDDLSGSSYHAATPMLVRLPTGETEIILCHRPDATTRKTNDYSVTRNNGSGSDSIHQTGKAASQSPAMDTNCTLSTQSTESEDYGSTKLLHGFLPTRRLPSPPLRKPETKGDPKSFKPIRVDDSKLHTSDTTTAIYPNSESSKEDDEDEDNGGISTEAQTKKSKMLLMGKHIQSTKESYVLLSGNL